MISIDKLLSLEREEISGAAEAVSQSDIWLLIDLLNEKDDKIRYHALLLLQSRSEYMEDVFPYWDIFCTKLKSDNSYQRNIGLMLLADNVKWDQENKIDQIIDEYLMLYSSGEMDNYISDALTGAILDNKSKKQIGLML